LLRAVSSFEWVYGRIEKGAAFRETGAGFRALVSAAKTGYFNQSMLELKGRVEARARLD